MTAIRRTAVIMPAAIRDLFVTKNEFLTAESKEDTLPRIFSGFIFLILTESACFFFNSVSILLAISHFLFRNPASAADGKRAENACKIHINIPKKRLYVMTNYIILSPFFQ